MSPGRSSLSLCLKVGIELLTPNDLYRIEARKVRAVALRQLAAATDCSRLTESLAHSTPPPPSLSLSDSQRPSRTKKINKKHNTPSYGFMASYCVRVCVNAHLLFYSTPFVVSK